MRAAFIKQISAPSCSVYIKRHSVRIVFFVGKEKRPKIDRESQMITVIIPIIDANAIGSQQYKNDQQTNFCGNFYYSYCVFTIHINSYIKLPDYYDWAKRLVDSKNKYLSSFPIWFQIMWSFRWCISSNDKPIKRTINSILCFHIIFLFFYSNRCNTTIRTYTNGE